MASGIGGVTTLLTNYDVLKEKGPRRVSPLAVPMLMPNSPAANVGLRDRRQGRRAHAGLGLRLRQRGDRARHRHDPARPRRRRRRRRHRGGDPPAADGRVRQHDGAVEAQRRARARARVRGTSTATASCSARAPACSSSSPRSTPRPAARGCTPRSPAPASPPTPTTSPSPTRRGSAPPGRCSIALREADLDAADIVHINAHATSTPQGDIAEAWRSTQRARRRRSTTSWSPSTKSMTGHLLGGAGALESVATVLGAAPPRRPADDQPRRPRPGRRPRHRHRAARRCPTATSPR